MSNTNDVGTKDTWSLSLFHHINLCTILCYVYRVDNWYGWRPQKAHANRVTIWMPILYNLWTEGSNTKLRNTRVFTLVIAMIPIRRCKIIRIYLRVAFLVLCKYWRCAGSRVHRNRSFWFCRINQMGWTVSGMLRDGHRRARWIWANYSS